MTAVKNGSSAPSDYETYLFKEGTLYKAYQTFGAHPSEISGTPGTGFTVWAPNASRVSVVGDFNDWNPDHHLMNQIDESGIWHLFIPGVGEGALYKYALTSPAGETFLKADPYAFFSEVRPATASVVTSLDHYEWHDSGWLREQQKRDSRAEPMLIYEVHAGTWKKHKDGTLFTYRELADDLIPYVSENGFTHIELMPVMEHPFDRSWGYQVTGYYAATSRYGRPEDLMSFIDQAHQAGIGVIFDWVPVHFCKDDHGLRLFDGTPTYEPADPRYAERPTWGTLNFDYSRPEVRSFLISNAMFWMDFYHADGFRVDAVSAMISLNHDNPHPEPLQNHLGGDENLAATAFIKQLNKAVFAQFPAALMIAEEATDWPLVTAPVHDGGLGFNYKWNMGWTHDTLRYMQTPLEDRAAHHHLLTFSHVYAFSENFILPISHDELVYGKRSLLNKMPGDMWQKFSGLRLLYGYFLTHPGKKLLFMGSEFGQFDEWKDETELDWFLFDYETHRDFHNYFRTASRLYSAFRCLSRLDCEPEGFEWIEPNDAGQSVISYIRKGRQRGDQCVVICNFSAEVYQDYRIGVPSKGTYFEVLNSDSGDFGGSNQVNTGDIQTEATPSHGREQSLTLKVPPLGITILMKKTQARERRLKSL